MNIFFTVNGWSPVGEFLPPSKLKPNPEPSLDNDTFVIGPKTRLDKTSESMTTILRIKSVLYVRYKISNKKTVVILVMTTFEKYPTTKTVRI